MQGNWIFVLSYLES